MTVTKSAKRITSILLILITIFSSLVFSTTAANASTSGSASNTKVLQVWTNKKGATPYITLNQSPDKYNYTNIWGNKKTQTVYREYIVEIKPVLTVDGGRTNLKKQTKYLKDGSEKITLKKGIYYEIVIKASPIPKAVHITGKQTQWSYWYLSKTKNCANYK